MIQAGQTTFNFSFFPQNENARRGLANDKYQKMRADLEAEKGKTAFLKEQITKSKRLFSFSHPDLVLCPYSPSTQCVLCFLRLAETIAKAKDIVEQSKHIQELDSENKILKQERKDMLKMHEESMKALQDSATEEMNRLKEEISILRDQKKATDEQNQRHHEAYKLLQQERDSLADTLWQAEASIFSK